MEKGNVKEAIKFFSLAIAAVAVLTAVIIMLGNDNITRAEEAKKAPATEPCEAVDVHKYVDPETGVNYLIYNSVEKAGITVRYNADGSIMVTPQN